MPIFRGRFLEIGGKIQQAKNGRLIWTGRHFESNPFMKTLAIQRATLD